MIRLRIRVTGTVQGVGFRPFVYGAARARGLSGWVQNGADGVSMEVAGENHAVAAFVESLKRDAPPGARVSQISIDVLPASAAPATEGFFIRQSAMGIPGPCLPADRAICTECEREIASPAARRYRYPFTNCTRCGPRYSIIDSLPYDRPRTSMRGFEPCAACRAEYEDPSDRRFHAQPIACPRCGPQLRLLGPDGGVRAEAERALDASLALLREGRILALKGLGGFQLLLDATNGAAVAELRRRKQREDKPFAVMFPSLTEVRLVCRVSDEEAALLCSPEAPIVLLERLPGAPALATETIAPRNPDLGVMLPCTPLHRLVIDGLGRPLVCTSGNLSEEPMCVEIAEALDRLGGIADAFLDHDRPVRRAIDDSVARVGPGGSQVLRRARGFAPLPLPIECAGRCVLALGANLKSTVALAREGEVIVSQHLGDLTSEPAAELLARTVEDLLRFFHARPDAIACDLHPDYVSTSLARRLAARLAVPLIEVQHHHAHVAACVAEHHLEGPVLGLCWDGSGLGTDGTLWGGEALAVEGAHMQRMAHLRPFRLPGGARAMREPRRAALGALYEVLGPASIEHLPGLFLPAETGPLLSMLRGGRLAPLSSSIGRLFDAVAAIAGLRAFCTFEGQAAMECEFAARAVMADHGYPLSLQGAGPWMLDFAPLLDALLKDMARREAPAMVCARFHEGLARAAVEMAARAGLKKVVLTGGCFQNALLTSRVRELLYQGGFEVYTPRMYPPNDGGIALGQVVVGLGRLREQG